MTRALGAARAGRMAAALGLGAAAGFALARLVTWLREVRAFLDDDPYGPWAED